MTDTVKAELSEERRRTVRSLELEDAKRMFMMWARLVTVVPLVLSGAVYAQSANERDTSLGSCLQSARLADAICRREKDPKLRSDCFQNVSAVQLECLERVSTEGATASRDSSSTHPVGPSANAAPNGPSNGLSLDERSQIKPDAAVAKPADEEPHPTAIDVKPVTGQEAAIQQRKPVTDQADEAVMKSSDRPADPATTASLPKLTKTDNRKGGLLCTQFRTYDAASGTYRAFDGRIRECRQAQGSVIVK